MPQQPKIWWVSTPSTPPEAGQASVWNDNASNVSPRAGNSTPACAEKPLRRRHFRVTIMLRDGSAPIDPAQCASRPRRRSCAQHPSAAETAMTVQAQPYPRVTALIEQLGGLVKRWQERSEMNELDSGEFDRIAREMGLSPGDLEAAVRQGRHAADE